MSEKILKFAQRVNKVVPELSVDALITMWEEESVETCKHKFLKRKKANTQCKTKLKGAAITVANIIIEVKSLYVSNK